MNRARAILAHRVRAAAAALAVAAALAGCAGASATPAPTGPAAVSSATQAIPTPTPTPIATPSLSPLPNNLAAAPCLATRTGGPYLAADGSAFTCLGRPVELTGYTFYPALLGGAKAWHKTSFQAYIDHVLDMGAASGQNLVRATDQWDKTTPGQRYDDPIVWQNMDYLVEAARERGVFVVIDLSAFRWLLISTGADPSQPQRWTAFIQFVAARYRDATNVAFYSIAGEPAPPTNQAQLDTLTAFYRSTSEALRAADPNHLITVGGLNHMEDSPKLGWWQAIDDLPDNDLVAFKTYSQHDLALMPTIASYARSIAKPAIDEEFGMPQGYGDATFAGGSGYNGLTGGRASFFANVYWSGLSLGVAGFVFWNMGCQLGATSYEVNPMTPAAWGVVTRNSAVPAAEIPAGSTGLCE